MHPSNSHLQRVLMLAARVVDAVRDTARSCEIVKVPAPSEHYDDAALQNDLNRNDLNRWYERLVPT